MIKIYCETGIKLSLYTDSLVNFDFIGLDLHRAKLQNTNLCQANFKSGKLRDIIIEDAIAQYADFSFSDLMFACLRRTDFSHCNFYRSYPIAAYFNQSNLTYANFKEALVRGCDFSQANLCGADLRFANYANAIFTDAVYDESTIWPIDFDPIAHGAILMKST